MTIDYTNKMSRTIRLIFSRNIASWFLKIILIILIFESLWIERDDSYLITILLSVFLLVVFVTDWFTYYKYLFQYQKCNFGKRFRIDSTNMTIQNFKGNEHAFSQRQGIKKIVLHRHIKCKLPYNNPTGFSDKIENLLTKDSNFRRFSNIWFVEIKTEDSCVYYLTPLMIKLKDIPFRNISIKYEEHPITKYGS